MQGSPEVVEVTATRTFRWLPVYVEAGNMDMSLPNWLTRPSRSGFVLYLLSHAFTAMKNAGNTLSGSMVESIPPRFSLNVRSDNAKKFLVMSLRLYSVIASPSAMMPPVGRYIRWKLRKI